MEKLKLDGLQLKIMQVLWEKEEASVIEIQEALLDSKELAITTIGTVLTRLEKRNIVSYRKSGKQYIYKAKIKQSVIKKTMVSTLVDKLFNGDKTSLVNFLVSEIEFEPNEIKTLKEKIDKLK